MSANDLEASITSYRDFYGSYHHHKEQMAYGATVVYLGAVTWVFLRGPDVLGCGLQRCLTIILFASTAAAAFVFVCWQLRKRQVAADIVDGCNKLLAAPLVKTTVAPDSYERVSLPDYLVLAIREAVAGRGKLQGPRPSAWITLAAMIVWTLLAGVRLFL